MWPTSSTPLPSQHDHTPWYDLMVFRRLAAGTGTERLFLNDAQGTASAARQALASIDTSPVGFALFDKVLSTAHPTDCSVRDFFVNRLSQTGADTHPDAADGRVEPGMANLDDEDLHLGAGLADLNHGRRGLARRMPTSRRT